MGDVDHPLNMSWSGEKISFLMRNGLLRNERSNDLILKIGTVATEPSASGKQCKVGCMDFNL
jgi:hypothetical protein